MSNALYRLFVKDVLSLAKTMVIKSTASATAINYSITSLGGTVDESDPTSWRYYKHLAGEYHSVDTSMVVKSFDTLEEIEFNKANLEVHRATAKAFVYGTPYYQTLVEKYPKQESLILGILNPVDINKAIAADDLQILWYDTNLVESNELNLIPKLQEWISAYYDRWYNPTYGVYHDLYDAFSLAGLFVLLVGQILGIRLENCKTQFAHSFHIWTYLGSNGNLREYKDFLTTKQALWLYRNIKYIQNNAGRQETFKLLIEHLLTERGIPVSAIEMRQNDQTLATALVPTVEMISEPINFTDATTSTKVSSTVAEIVERENSLANDNAEFAAEEIESAEFRMSRSRISRLPTKVIESNAIDRSDSVPFKLIDVLLNEWVHLTAEKRYNVALSFQNPSDSTTFSISAKDAFVLWLYVLNKSRGITLAKVPSIEAKRVLKLTPPSRAEITPLVDRRFATTNVLDALYNNLPAVGLVGSTEAFYALCSEIHTNMLYRYSVATIQEQMHARLAVQVLGDQFYNDVEIDLGGGATYSHWLMARGLSSIAELGKTDASILATNILDKATGQDLSTHYTLREIQAALLKLMTQLSSYTIQFISTTSAEPYILVGSSDLRVGDQWSREDDFTEVSIPVGTVLEEETRELDVANTEMLNKGIKLTEETLERGAEQLDATVAISIAGVTVDYTQFRMPSVRFSIVDSGDDAVSLPALDEVLLQRVLEGFINSSLN